MCAGDFEVVGRVVGEAVVPVDYAVLARVDRRVSDRRGRAPEERAAEFAAAVRRVALRLYPLALLLQDAKAYALGKVKDVALHDRALNRRSERDDGGDLVGHLHGQHVGDHASEAVADQVNLAPGLGGRLLHGGLEPFPDEQVGTIGVESDVGVVRTIADAPQPAVHVPRQRVRPHKAGDDDDGGTVAMRHFKPVVDRR